MQMSNYELLGPLSDDSRRLDHAVEKGDVPSTLAIIASQPSLYTAAIVRAFSCGRTDIARTLTGVHKYQVQADVAAAAVRTCSKDAIDLVLSNGWDVNAPCASRLPMLCLAISNLALVGYLLSRGADPNIAHGVDDTPLSSAVRQGNLDVIEMLLRAGGRPWCGQLMHNAVRCERQSEAVMQLLYDNGAPLDDIEFANHPPSLRFRQDFERGTPLHIAVAMGRARAVRFLLERGADPRKLNSWGQSVRAIALRTGHNNVLLSVV